MGLFDFFKKERKVSIIMCICYDMPSINSLKPSIQATIVDREEADGNEITSNSRIIFDSFSDNTMLYDKDNHYKLIKHNLVNFGFHHTMNVDLLAKKFVNKGSMQSDFAKPFLATFYVLYE